jgi:hypothetical protein
LSGLWVKGAVWSQFVSRKPGVFHPAFWGWRHSALNPDNVPKVVLRSSEYGELISSVSPASVTFSYLEINYITN